MRTLVSIFLVFGGLGRAQVPRFAAHELANDLKGGYQVVVADVNGDGKPDLIALASGMPDLVWFENPGWQRHVLASGFNRMINCAFEVVDGKPVVVLASEFNNDSSKSVGLVTVLTPDGDVTRPWKAQEIDRLPTSHRIRVMKVGGRTVFLNTPLTDAAATPPEYRGHVSIVLYRPGVWKREVVSSEEEGVLHGVWIEGPDSFLTASFLGIHRFQFVKQKWIRTEISRGDPGAWPKGGSSDVAEWGDVIAAIEPWHGNQVVVYENAGKSRKVIDSSLSDGHTITMADLRGDHHAQIIAGYRGKGTSVNIYDRAGGEWKRTVLDDRMAAAACATADLNGDGRVDIVCIGSATQNLKWYENLGR
jgi:hypothetical protein